MKAAAQQKPVVFVIDDDEAVRRSLGWLIGSVDMEVRTYGSAQQFIEDCSGDCVGCIVADVRMPGMSGLELQKALNHRHYSLPIILITGHGDVQMAVRALKAGAFDFIEKPFNDQLLLDRVGEAVASSVMSRDRQVREAGIRSRLETLTARECEVLDLIVEGEPNKRVAHALGLSEKTVEFHRAHVMEKMAASSLADLVRKVMTVRGA